MMQQASAFAARMTNDPDEAVRFISYVMDETRGDENPPSLPALWAVFSGTDISSHSTDHHVFDYLGNPIVRC